MLRNPALWLSKHRCEDSNDTSEAEGCTYTWKSILLYDNTQLEMVKILPDTALAV